MKKSRKILSAIFAFIMGAATLGGVVGCDDNAVDTGPNNVHIWSTYNTLKVLRDYEGPVDDGGTYPDLGEKIEVFMALGETEGAQLMVTPEKAVKSAILTAGEMKNADGVIFPADSIKIYYQGYMEVLNKTSGQTNYNYPIGWYPDLLVPMEKSVEYGENTIGAGHNQGFNIEFTTTSDTVPGIYTGNFTLDIDGVKTTIPAKVEVESIDITQCYGYTSIWSLYTQNMDGILDTVNSYRMYYETSLNEYKFCLDKLPNSADPALMAQEAVRYWDNPNFTSFTIPQTGVYQGDSFVTAKGRIYDYVYELAKASKPGMVLTDRAYYSVLVDEPDTREGDFCIQAVVDCQANNDKIIEDLRKENFYTQENFPDNTLDEIAQFKIDLEESLYKLTVMQTMTEYNMRKHGTAINSYCSHVYRYNSSAVREEYYEVREQNKDRGGELWYYTCMEPRYPHPTDHLDDYMISLRTMRWMQKAWDLDGYLHWAFFCFTPIEVTLDSDAYNTSTRFPGTPGDAWKLYPGTKYGIYDTYLPSIRLLQFRDGQEDYNMLCELDNQVRANEEYYGLSSGVVDLDKFLSPLYNSLFTGSVYNPNDADFYEAKRSLFDITKFFANDSKILVNNKVENGKNEVSVYLANGYTLKVDGVEQTAVGPAGQGQKFVIEKPLTQEVNLKFEVFKDGKPVCDYQMFIAGKSFEVLLEENALSPMLTTLDQSTVTYNEDKSATINLVSKGNNIFELTSYIPYVQFNSIVNLSKVDTISFTLKNNETRNIEILVRFNSGFNNLNLTSYEIPAGESIDIKIKDVSGYGGSFKFLSTSKLQFYVENYVSGENGKETAPPVNFTISKVSYSMIKEG